MIAMDRFDTDQLIAAVEQRPVLWDENSVDFGDNALQKVAWREVFCLLRENYCSMSANDKEDFGRAVMRRWNDVKDSPRRFIKKEYIRTLGLEAVKNCDLSKSLMFLVNGIEEVPPPPRHASATHASTTPSQGDLHLHGQVLSLPGLLNMCRKRRRVGEPPRCGIRERIQITPPCPKLTFLKNQALIVKEFTELEFLDFQMGVLGVIRDIKAKRLDNSAQADRGEELPPPSTPIEPVNLKKEIVEH